MKRRYIIVICFACLIIFACLVSQFTVSQIQTDNALKYEEVNKISPLNISKKTLTVSQKLKLYIDSTNDTSDTSEVTTTSISRESALLDGDTVVQEFFEELNKISEDVGLTFNVNKNDIIYKNCNPNILSYYDDPSYYAIFWDVNLESDDWMISFVMDDESHMIFNLNISSVNSKALFNKNDNISDSFTKGLGKYFDAKNINADFYDNVDFNELFLDYSFDNDIDAECLVSFNTNCSEISFAFKFGNYRDESEEIAE